jgi:hypothetical protein
MIEHASLLEATGVPSRQELGLPPYAEKADWRLKNCYETARARALLKCRVAGRGPFDSTGDKNTGGAVATGADFRFELLLLNHVRSIGRGRLGAGPVAKASSPSPSRSSPTPTPLACLISIAADSCPNRLPNWRRLVSSPHTLT